MSENLILKYNGFICDLDGTVYRENNLIPEANRVFDKIISQNKRFVFISNRTTSLKESYAAKLNEFGIKCVAQDIITTSEVTKDYLLEFHPKQKAFIIGEESFVNYLNSFGIETTNNQEEIDIVIVSLDRTLTFEKFHIAQNALKNGARFFAANIDLTCPIESDEIPDAGATIAALERLTEKKLDMSFGKPSEFILSRALKKIDLPKSECLIIGDRIETDITMGCINGIDTALVLSGVTQSYIKNGRAIEPTYILKDISCLIENIERH